MKLYRLECTPNPDDGEALVVEWVGTQAEIAGVRKGWMKDFDLKRTDIELEEIEVPTNKKGLLEFLNDYGV